MLLCVRFLFSSPRALLNKKIKKRERYRKRERESGRATAAFICYESLAIIPPLQSEKVNLLVPARRWMTVVSSAGLLARRCVYTDVSDAFATPLPPSPLFNMFPFVFLVSETKCCREGREKGCRLECKAWWEAWWWQAWRIWYRCPLESFIASCL